MVLLLLLFLQQPTHYVSKGEHSHNIIPSVVAVLLYYFRLMYFRLHFPAVTLKRHLSDQDTGSEQ
ncbi:hypothetical protein AYY18_01520 [Morganella psychrotolerans]|uniref:Uncharacterized protein n=1 Tax=Morganella psychrotolerans TaxID=368603 RepID=A0A1B8HU96_9GAMM|nr:hypothetical protein AYY18_01520 [Morganella psychrotolerans]